MQNKPNFRKAKMNVNIYNIKDYQNFIPLAGYKNKPNSNPNKANFRKARMNVNLTLTRDYRKNDDFLVRKNKPNSNPISSKPKMSVNSFITKDYRKKDAFAVQKNKPNPSGLRFLLRNCRTDQTQFQTRKNGKNLDSGLSLIFLLTIFNMPFNKAHIWVPAPVPATTCAGKQRCRQGGVPIPQLWELR